MKILVGCDLSYRTSGPATLILNVQPARHARQAILRETLTITPEDTRRESRVTAVCNWVNDRIAYVAGASQWTTTATETLLSGAGVCRDFAHLSIALCRALGIPARFVSAHAPGLVPPDFHAVFEAWLGDRWWLFDATRQAPLDALVRIGQGRDAAEAAFAELHGPIMPEAMQVHARVVEGPDPATAPRTTEAVAA
jgi:transglutaminase-like putative cysteine protease